VGASPSPIKNLAPTSFRKLLKEITAYAYFSHKIEIWQMCGNNHELYGGLAAGLRYKVYIPQAPYVFVT
jgi:hypothetical protein